MNKIIFIIALFMTASTGCKMAESLLVYSSEDYSVYRDSVVQGDFVARAVSRTELVSNYVSPADAFKSPAVKFKFSINGADNAAPPGKDNNLICTVSNGDYVSPVIKFGDQYIDSATVPAGEYLGESIKITFRADMNEVLKSFKEKGFYTCYDGTSIYKNDFRGVFIAGNTAPLTWDFNNLHSQDTLQLKDADGDGIYEITLTLNQHPGDHKTATSWKLARDISAFPRYLSPDVLPDALYNLALEEMEKAIEPDSTFRTGKEWAGVWTRDISYSIILSMAMLQPEVSINSLRRKVKNGKIIQDTGTGGAYPVSTDRMIWAVAAWEVYKVTGDKNWLVFAYEVIKNSMEDDLKNIHDPHTGLVKGESSFLDWREQTYPVWMQPADIYESECLGTNSVHFEASAVLSEMAAVLGFSEAAARYGAVAAKIKTGINTYLWQEDKGYYGQYLYGRNDKILSSRSEALGEALSVLFRVADKERGQAVIARTPVTPFGISCIYPQIPGIPPYHNSAVWPFVESFWAQASAGAGNEQSVVKAISSVYRPAALFLTNKENFVSTDGDYAGTQINSDNMLWSLSGSLSLVYKVLFGMRFNREDLSFSPFVPEVFKGKRSLYNFKYRAAILDIEMEGFGNVIQSFLIDGKEVASNSVPSSLRGSHHIKIVLSNKPLPADSINQVVERYSPPTPELTYNQGILSWNDTGRNVVAYKILYNGKLLDETTERSLKPAAGAYGTYQVIAVSDNKLESFASEPLPVYAKERIVQLEDFNPASGKPYQDFTGTGFVETSHTVNRKVSFTVNIDKAGVYSLDLRYANGNGPVNTENKCAFRTMYIDDRPTGTLVFPQRGKEEWSNWGWSNPLKITLSEGVHHFYIGYADSNENMNGAINQAMLDCVRITF